MCGRSKIRRPTKKISLADAKERKKTPSSSAGSRFPPRRRRSLARLLRSRSLARFLLTESAHDRRQHVLGGRVAGCHVDLQGGRWLGKRKRDDEREREILCLRKLISFFFSIFFLTSSDTPSFLSRAFLPSASFFFFFFYTRTEMKSEPERRIKHIGAAQQWEKLEKLGKNKTTLSS